MAMTQRNWEYLKKRWEGLSDEQKWAEHYTMTHNQDYWHEKCVEMVNCKFERLFKAVKRVKDLSIDMEEAANGIDFYGALEEIKHESRD
jgi:hypothetical protein